MEVQALEGPQALAALLCEMGDLNDVRVDGDNVRFVQAGAAPERAALLETLLARGLHISHFAAVAEDLQASYIKSIARSQTH